MSSMWRNAMVYLGLGPDDEYAFNHNHSPQTTFSSFCKERRYFGTGVPGKVLGQLV